MIIFLTALYIFIGITISISNQRMEEELEIPFEERGDNTWNYLVLPLTWFFILVYEAYFKSNNEE